MNLDPDSAPRIIVPGPQPVPGFHVESSPEVERLVVQKPEIQHEAPQAVPSPRELEREQPAPEDLREVPLTARQIVACAAARDLLRRVTNPSIVINALLTMRHTRAEAEAAVRLVLYMQKR